MTDLASHYLEEMKRQFRGHKRMGEAAMAQLEDKDFFVALNPESNSIAAMVKHIAGNARSRFTDFLTRDGEKPDRQEPHTVMQALNRALAHYAQHIGQIVFLAKHLRASEWQTLSIPRGKSEDYKTVSPKGFRRGTHDPKA